MQKVVAQPAREIPVVAEADVVVCGGGPGGVSAAIAAARHGARVTLVERYGCLGGMGTTGLVAPILGHKAVDRPVAIVEGLLREVTERLHALGGAPTWEESLTEWGIRFDAEALKYVWDELVRETEVNLLLHSLVTDVIKEGDEIRAIVLENKSGSQAVAGRLFIDATGDADVAFRAGAPTRQGRELDGRVMAWGSFVHLAGFTWPDEAQAREIDLSIKEEIQAGRLRFYNPNLLARNAHHKDHTSANMTRFVGDPTKVADWTLAEAAIRRDVWDLVRYLRANVPGFEGCYVQQLSPQVGVRESRQIVGPYVLTGDDVRLGAKFDDGIARGSWYVDIHCPYGHVYPVAICEAACPRTATCPYWATVHSHMGLRHELQPKPGDWHDIPYRVLLSVGVPNLLASGRCISATHEGMAGPRVMGTCIAIGQAAGTAAAMSLREGIDPARLDVRALRAALCQDGQLV